MPRNCSNCDEMLPDGASYCPACGHEVIQEGSEPLNDEAEVAPEFDNEDEARWEAQAAREARTDAITGCLKPVLIIGGGFFVIFLCYGIYYETWRAINPEAAAERDEQMRQERIAEQRERSEERQREVRAEREAEIAERQSGFHCLSRLNGSHRQVVEQVRDRLRNPSSFEHVETRIGTRDSAGRHTLVMTYRAENGFGGTNVERALATVVSDTCEARVLSGG